MIPTICTASSMTHVRRVSLCVWSLEWSGCVVQELVYICTEAHGNSSSDEWHRGVHCQVTESMSQRGLRLSAHHVSNHLLFTHWSLQGMTEIRNGQKCLITVSCNRAQ